MCPRTICPQTKSLERYVPLTVRAWLTRPPDTASLGHVTGFIGQECIDLKGTHHPRDASSRGHKIQENQNLRRIIHGHIVQGYNILSPMTQQIQS